MKANPILAKSGGILQKTWAEFRDFAFKGNMIDLAIAVVLGAAFTQLVTSFTNEIFKPMLDFVVSHIGGSATTGHMLPASWAHVNNFISALLNFLINAFAIFILFVKVIGALTKKVVPAPAATEPTTKECPMCLSVIPIKARKCAHCTSDLPAA